MKEIDKILRHYLTEARFNEAKAATQKYTEDKIVAARIDELENLPIFYEYVESGDDRLESQATKYIKDRIATLRKGGKNG
jgi:hypothetical protein